MNNAYTVRVNNKTWYLNTKIVSLVGNRQQRIYYFSGDYRPETSVSAIPDGYKLTSNPRTGIPMLKKDK
jgi:hypothetical protein